MRERLFSHCLQFAKIILLSLPVSVATAERSFSTLRRVKTWIRSRMGEERLTGLALLNIHRDIPVDAESAIERFAKKRVGFWILCFKSARHCYA